MFQHEYALAYIIKLEQEAQQSIETSAVPLHFVVVQFIVHIRHPLPILP